MDGVTTKWIPIDSGRARLIREALADILQNGYGGLTDLSGEFGDPKIIDTWGIGDLPLLKAETKLGGEKDSSGCYHQPIETRWTLAIHTEEEEDDTRDPPWEGRMKA